MRLKRVPRWLVLVYWLTSFAIVVVAAGVGYLASAMGPVRIGNLAVSDNLAWLVVATVLLPAFAILVPLLFTRSGAFASRHERWTALFLDVFLALCGGAALLVAIGLSAGYVANHPQDVAPLAIIWAFVAPALVRAGTGLVTGIGDVIRNKSVERARRTGDQNPSGA